MSASLSRLRAEITTSGFVHHMQVALAGFRSDHRTFRGIDSSDLVS